jgi:hemolysin activation/secretion protein
VANAYKSLDLPGVAHHVLAVRAAYGWADRKTASDFTAGGVSGSSLEIAPGVVLGDGRRTFFARGFPGGAERGSQAVAGSAEYRLPIAAPAVGYKFLPLFLQRVSAAVFTDAASAWCPGTYAVGSAVCPVQGTTQQTMASVGAELQLNAALQYDVPFLFRFGAATPVAGRSYFGTSKVAAYFTVGLAF